ncbi:MAG: SprT family zinc-dependent metalloprotease, partial [Pseudomonadota bacterium]
MSFFDAASRFSYDRVMLHSLFSNQTRRKPYHHSVEIEVKGEMVTVDIRHNARAKRYTLRLPQAQRTPVLTIPKTGTYDEAMAFLLRHTNWLAERLAKSQDFVPLAPDSMVPIRGVAHRLVATGSSRGTIKQSVEDDEAQLQIAGDSAHFERRLKDWLKKQAKADLTAACTYHADNLGLHFKSISVRDQRTRWGSCSSGGRLNFSWRLIMAPPEVLDYVAAHEVA